MKTFLNAFGVAGILAGFAMAGCSSMPKTIEKPDVALQGLDIQKATLTDATVVMKLEIRNPNPFSINVDSVKYGLNMDGKPFANGKMLEGAKVPANGETQLIVPMTMNYLDLYSRFSDLVKKGAGSYQLKGNVVSGKLDFPFEHQGDIKLPNSG